MKWLSNFISGRQESVSYGMVESNPKPRCSQMAFLRGDEKKKKTEEKKNINKVFTKIKKKVFTKTKKKYLEKQKQKSN